MPASFTHYAFGKAVLEQLDDSEIKNILLTHRELFDIGLHGPDILFFYKPYKLKGYSRIGHIMHEKPAYPFFNNAKKRIEKQENREKSFAYILGFICHFVLDSMCHGYVQQIIEETKISHLEIEAEYDRRWLIKEHLDPLRYPLTKHIHVNKENSEIIAPFFGVKTDVIFTALKSMKFYDHLFLAPNPLKRGAIYSTLKLTLLYKHFQGLIMNYHTNPKLDRYFLHFDALFNDSIYIAVDKIKEFYYFSIDDYYNKNYK